MPVRRTRKTTRPRRTTVRRRPRKTQGVKMMRRVARAEALKLSESKRFVVLNENALANQPTALSTQWAIKSPFAQLATGAQSFQVVGNEIQRPLLKLKFYFQIDWGLLRADRAINYATVALNVYLVATNNENFTSGTPASFTNVSTISGFDWFYQREGFKVTLNGNNVKVLKKWHREVTPDQVAGTTGQGIQAVTGSMKYRWRRKLTYEDSAVVPGVGGPPRATSLRGWNYWILVGTQVNTDYASALTAPPVAVVDSYLYYKDP